MGHFGINKTLHILQEHFFWPHMRRDMERYYQNCIVCKKTKSRVNPHGFYNPLLILTEPWIDISMEFILRLLRSSHGKDSIFVMVDRF